MWIGSAEWDGSVLWWCQEVGRGVMFQGRCRNHRSEVPVAAGEWQRGLVLVAVRAEEHTAGRIHVAVPGTVLVVVCWQQMGEKAARSLLGMGCCPEQG